MSQPYSVFQRPGLQYYSPCGGVSGNHLVAEMISIVLVSKLSFVEVNFPKIPNSSNIIVLLIGTSTFLAHLFLESYFSFLESLSKLNQNNF